MRKDEYSCSLRALQHYMYCPHRWGLIYNDCSWAENYFVTKANLMHTRVHDSKQAYTSRKKRVLTSVTVYNDILNLYGVTDCIEIDSDRNALQKQKQPKMTIVEYKPRHPADADYNQDDLMQVFAQKVCVDWVFHCQSEGILYYADTRQRVQLPLKENYDRYYTELLVLLEAIRKHISSGDVPPIRKKQKCRGCSFMNICMPRTNRKRQKNLFQQLEEMYR